jgi:large subunit ribosomal protein L22
MAYNYTVPIGEKSACAVGMNLPISLKQSVEVCNFIRGKPVEKAKALLASVIAEKQPVPYKQFNGDVGHRKGNMAAGRYPIKTCTHILQIVESAESNAQFKGLVPKDLILKQVCAQGASNTPRYGRQRGRYAKRIHIEVVVEEKK